MYMTIGWLVALIVFIIIEFVTMGLTTIWFAGGALVASVAAAFQAPIWLQVTLFLVVILLLLFFTRPIARKHFNLERAKTNIDGLIGRQAVVKVRIDNLRSTGEVTVGGMDWSARAVSDDSVFEESEIVVIKAIKGVKLIVERGTGGGD